MLNFVARFMIFYTCYTLASKIAYKILDDWGDRRANNAPIFFKRRSVWERLCEHCPQF